MVKKVRGKNAPVQRVSVSRGPTSFPIRTDFGDDRLKAGEKPKVVQAQQMTSAHVIFMVAFVLFVFLME
jgi:hypothetical protein